MNLFYRNGILYVEINNDFNFDTSSILERRIFRILDDYGIDKITININGKIERDALVNFKRDYYHKYKGYLIIK